MAMIAIDHISLKMATFDQIRADEFMVGVIIVIIVSAAIEKFVFLLFYKTLQFVENSTMSALILSVIAVVALWTYLYTTPQDVAEAVV